MAEPERKRSRRGREGQDFLAETLQKWRGLKKEIDSSVTEPIRKVPAKGSRKGCMRGEGGPENSNCTYRVTFGSALTSVKSTSLFYQKLYKMSINRFIFSYFEGLYMKFLHFKIQKGHVLKKESFWSLKEQFWRKLGEKFFGRLGADFSGA